MGIEKLFSSIDLCFIVRVDLPYPVGDMVDPNDQSWAAWAWSYVPPILPSAEYEDLDILPEEQSRKKAEPPVMVIGIFVHKASIVFKVCCGENKRC